MSETALIEKDHLLEKLEFALAISQSNGDKKRSDEIRKRIKQIGFNYEEPGT